MDVVFTAGSGKLAIQSKYLSRSIEEFGDFNESYAFIPENEISHIPDSILSELRSDNILLTGEIPIEDYPISAKIQGLIQAEKQTSASSILLLDTDTVLLNQFPQSIDNSAAFAACPQNIGINRYWTSNESTEDWKSLEARLKIDRGKKDINTLVDDVSTRPIFNAGVVVTKRDLAKEWLDYTRQVYYEASKKEMNSDQVALGLLAEEYDYSLLNRKYNNPVPHYLRFQKDTVVLHYFEMGHLIRILNGDIKKKLNTIGICNEFSNINKYKSLATSSYGFKRPIKGRIGRFVRKYMNILDH
jgi:hypothetical protein